MAPWTGSTPRPFALPRPVARGDWIAVIAPSSPFDAALGWRGLGFLKERGYRLRFDREMFRRDGYLAGSDARRRDELHAALTSPEVRAIIAVRGGYGASRFCHTLPWPELAADPKWIIGFSDVTALHVEAARVGVASLHAPHVTALGRSDARGRDAFVEMLERPAAARTYRALTSITPGSAQGTLVGGNLTLLHACAAAGRLRLPEDALLFLEDVTERPYRIDRMLTTLQVGGHFSTVRGVVLGDFTDCHAGPDRVSVESVLLDRLGSMGIPVASGVPAGHDRQNDPLLFGAWCALEVLESTARFVIGDG